MEHGLRHGEIYAVAPREPVLILIVMEHGLRQAKWLWTLLENCLNPYCNGTWSPTSFKGGDGTIKEVLILIVMEHGLRHSFASVASENTKS